MQHRAMTVFSIFVLVACSGDPTAPALNGSWGGEGIAFTVTSRGATMQFDCGSGEIPGPIRLSEGRFDARGTAIVHGGTPMEGQQPDIRGITLQGEVVDKEMVLNVTITGSTPTQYQLLKDAPAILRLCM